MSSATKHATFLETPSGGSSSTPPSRIQSSSPGQAHTMPWRSSSSSGCINRRMRRISSVRWVGSCRRRVWILQRIQRRVRDGRRFQRLGFFGSGVTPYVSDEGRRASSVVESEVLDRR
ncbi:hypothetical protein BJX68DRAFT_230280 [Aspergillus pseudodeflectus]|uniref:Uncharacterized protein n=1 Tax=Aspergillus pseudodeflectus TaxID=176178 RepID=A0ABR4KVD3_9EURO